MQSKVPKFIDVEDRVIAGLTWKQFVYLALSAMVVAMLNSLFVTALALPFSFIALALGISLAFAHVNGRPFSLFLGSLWRYNFNPRRYYWHKEAPHAPQQHAEKTETRRAPTADTVPQERLKEIALSLDMNHRVIRRDFRS